MSKPLLFVIAQGDPKGRNQVARLLDQQPGVEIVRDRRCGARRALHPSPTITRERRRRDRRVHQIAPELAERGWAFVRHPDGAARVWSHGVGPLVDAPRYEYYRGSASPPTVQRTREAALFSLEILRPALRNPQYLVLRARSRILSRWVEALPKTGLHVLDIGGRLQPYRRLFAPRLASYTAIDPVFEGLLNVVAVGEDLPFRPETFDVVLCTQTLNYTANPFQVIAEIHRVLRRGGACILSVPIWRLMPPELDLLLTPFASSQIVPEGASVAGLCSIVNLLLDRVLGNTARWWRIRRLLTSVVFPATNLAARLLETGCRTCRFTTNYSCLAFK